MFDRTREAMRRLIGSRPAAAGARVDLAFTVVELVVVASVVGVLVAIAVPLYLTHRSRAASAALAG